MTNMSKPAGGSEDLASDCWQLVFNHLENGDLKSVSLTCKNLLKISNLIKKSLKVVHPHVTMLSQHLNRFTELKHIDLSKFEGDLDEAIGEVARSGLNLETLDLSHQNAPFMMLESLRVLGSNPKMKNLKALNYALHSFKPKHLQDNDLLAAIANSFPNLEELKIGNYYGIESLASKLKFLKTIYMDNVADQSLVAFSLNCVFLKDVSVSRVTEHGVGILLRNRPNLESLSLSYIKTSPSNITIENSISHAKALACFKFYGMRSAEKILMEIAKAKLPLEDLELSYFCHFTVSGLARVLSNHHLKRLCIEGNFFDADMELLFKGNLGNLIHIDIRGYRMKSSLLFLLSANCPSLVEIGITAHNSEQAHNDDIQLCKNHNIRLLVVDLSGITDGWLELLGLSFPNLKFLTLILDSRIVTISRGIEAILKSCKFITELQLYNFEHEKIIEVNSELQEVNLEVLTLGTLAIDDEGLAVIGRKCLKLVHLKLDSCPNVTTGGLKQTVKDIKTLTRLSFNDCTNVDYGEFLEWMLSTDLLGSLKEITLPEEGAFTEEQRDEFLHRGCLLRKY